MLKNVYISKAYCWIIIGFIVRIYVCVDRIGIAIKCSIVFIHLVSSFNLTLKPAKASILATLRNAPKTQRPVYWPQLHTTKQTPIVSIL